MRKNDVIYLNPPSNCDLCQQPLAEDFIDGRTRFGAWANLCLRCWTHSGAGRLGTGVGQWYHRQDDGSGRCSGQSQRSNGTRPALNQNLTFNVYARAQNERLDSIVEAVRAKIIAHRDSAEPESKPDEALVTNVNSKDN